MAESPLAMAARMLVSGLGPERKDALLALLCKDDPGKVVQLYAMLEPQPQSPIPVPPTFVAPIVVSPTPHTPSTARGEDRQPAKRARTGSFHIIVSTPATSDAQSGPSTLCPARPLDTEGNDKTDMEDEVEGEHDDGDNTDDESEAFGEAEGHQGARARAGKPVNRTKLYKDLDQPKKDRCDRLLAHDTEYRRIGGSTVKKRFATWVAIRERQAVADGILPDDVGIAFSTAKALLDFLIKYGYGCRAQYAQLARWHEKEHFGMPNPNRGYDLPEEPALADLSAPTNTNVPSGPSTSNSRYNAPSTSASQPLRTADPVTFGLGLSRTAIEISDGYAACQSVRQKERYLDDLGDQCDSILQEINIACALPATTYGRGDIKVLPEEVDIQTVFNALGTILDICLMFDFATPASLSADLWRVVGQRIQKVVERLLGRVEPSEDDEHRDRLEEIKGKITELKATLDSSSYKANWATRLLGTVDKLINVKERIE